MQQRTPLIPKTLYVEAHDESSNVAVDVALNYNDDFKEHIFSYVNNINTIEGGTHVHGFQTGTYQGVLKLMVKTGLV
jgi:DNA gyrase subunit B